MTLGRALPFLLVLVLAASACRAYPTIAPGHALVRVHTAGGEPHFMVEVADTAEAQRTGLMHRRGLPDGGGMLFAPYPAAGGTAARATFWMKDTPLPLDIIFIRADHTIDGIAAHARPDDETMLSSEGPVTAVLEVAGGRAAALGIRSGDRVEWEIGR